MLSNLSFHEHKLKQEATSFNIYKKQKSKNCTWKWLGRFFFCSQWKVFFKLRLNSGNNSSNKKNWWIINLNGILINDCKITILHYKQKSLNKKNKMFIHNKKRWWWRESGKWKWKWMNNISWEKFIVEMLMLH